MKKKLIAILVLALVVSTVSVFAFGIGVQGGGGIGGGGLAVTFKLDQLPYVFAADLTIAGDYFFIGGTADLWMMNANLAGPVNYFVGGGLGASVGVGGDDLYLNVSPRVVAGLNMLICLILRSHSICPYISMLVYPIRSLGRIIGDFGKSSVAAKRIDEILLTKDEYQNDGKEITPITGNISFENVSFKFDDTDKHLLTDVSFEIKSGETVAVVGKTGSGKSTIANILVRMLDYDQGSIKLDGVELKELSKKYVRENVGIILQDPFLYAKTVYENIGIASPSSSNEDIYKAAKTAAIHKDIQGFDKGYDTLVGEKGVTLSGGQKQRIAIARMLVLNKPIIIFDDSLSALDTKTDLQIRNALKLRNDKMTSIIITHRITTAKEADKIIVLEEGKVSAIGTHEELSKKEGLYKSLWDIQGALEEEFLKMVDKEVSE